VNHFRQEQLAKKEGKGKMTKTIPLSAGMLELQYMVARLDQPDSPNPIQVQFPVSPQ
jgi:hypothetical protein